MKHLLKLLADHQMFHSDFQMDHMITARAGGTPYGQYKQALRELSKRYRGLKDLYSARELLAVDLDELAEPAPPSATVFDERRRKIKLVQKRMEADTLDRTVKDTEREFRRFYAQAVALKAVVGDLTPERRAQLDREMWAHKFKCMAAVELMTAGRLGPGTLELLQATPKAWRAPLMTQVTRDQDSLTQWFLDYETLLPDLQISRDQEPLALP